MWFTVGTDQAVTTEITETGNSLRTIITTVSPVPFPALVYFAERLVYPVPYVTALCHRLAFEDIPIFLQAAATVTHCMQVFTKDEKDGKCLSSLHTLLFRLRYGTYGSKYPYYNSVRHVHTARAGSFLQISANHKYVRS